MRLLIDGRPLVGNRTGIGVHTAEIAGRLHGEPPLIDGNPARPNEKHFQHVDYVVSKAESLGTDGSGAMVRELSTLRERNAELERQNREGLKAYRKKLNSNYAWESGAFSRWNGGEVESVYDDGRFTYVRVKDGAQGLLSIMAEIDGRATLLEYSYDAPTRTYQISGIFPKFTMRSGEQTMSVLRKGEGATS